MKLRLLAAFPLLIFNAAADGPLPGTAPLTLEGDLASQMVDGAHRFLDRELEAAANTRKPFPPQGNPGGNEWRAAADAERDWLTGRLGIPESRGSGYGPRSTVQIGSENVRGAGKARTWRSQPVQWECFHSVTAEGLLLDPDKAPVALVVLLPDAGQAPEELAGLEPGGPPLGAMLAERGCRVLIPYLTGLLEEETPSKKSGIIRRERLYRSAFELGNHIIGYEIRKASAAVDWFVEEPGAPPVWIVGRGEGGYLAFLAGALETRVSRVICIDGFGSLAAQPQQPAWRNVFGLIARSGDAELAALIAPRKFHAISLNRKYSEVRPGGEEKPGVIVSPGPDALAKITARAADLAKPVDGTGTWITAASAHDEAAAFAAALDDAGLAEPAEPDRLPQAPVTDAGKIEERNREARQYHEMDRHTQEVLAASQAKRDTWQRELDTTSPEAYAACTKKWRKQFEDEVIGKFDHPLLPPNARSRPMPGSDKWERWEVVLDVLPDIFAYGILTVPRDIAPGERRPVVVCQHGLEGRPQFLLDRGEGWDAYKAYATRLAEEGFITFAPQHLYIFGDRFRQLQFKANALGRTLFSLMIPQHRQIVQWLGAQPFCDPQRIAFYGLSYGGKSAMRIPACMPEYCLSICSADFNEWVWKNASSSSPYSYVHTGEYEIFEWDLGSRYNYAEMAALIAPRPFMVERGHADGVAPDEMVALEYARVRRLYAARLKIPDRTEIEFFDGPHTINGAGTFAFLRRHLQWPAAR